MRAWQLAAALAGSRLALDTLLRDDRLTPYLGGADHAEQLVGPGARRRLRAPLPAELAAAVLSDTPVGLPPRSAAADRDWSQPTPWRPPINPPAVMGRYLDELSAEIENTRRADSSTLTVLSWLAWAVGRAINWAMMAILFVCLAPLALAISGLLSLGPARGRRPAQKRITRAARAIGATDGRLMERDGQAGVFGEGPYGAQFITQRPGDVADVTATLLERAVEAGYRRELAEIHDWGFTFPRSAARPQVTVKVIGEGQLFAEYRTIGYPLHQVRGWRDARPVLVQGPYVSALGPGKTYKNNGRIFSYSLVVPPFVPVGSCAVVVSFLEPRDT